MNEETKEQVVENDIVKTLGDRVYFLMNDFMTMTDWKKENKESLAKELLAVENAFKVEVQKRKKEFKTLTSETARRENWAVRKNFENYIKVVHSNYLCVLQGK